MSHQPMILLDIKSLRIDNGTMHFKFAGNRIKAPAQLFRKNKLTGMWWVNKRYAERNLI